jgi:Protein of unknown function (DUF2794)
MTDQTQTAHSGSNNAVQKRTWFDRRELELLLRIYGRLVAEGECRDYAIGAFGDYALFCMHKRASEAPTWTVEKRPELARRQGAFSITNSAGLILKRGHDLAQVLLVLEKKRFQVVD